MTSRILLAFYIVAETTCPGDSPISLRGFYGFYHLILPFICFSSIPPLSFVEADEREGERKKSTSKSFSHRFAQCFHRAEATHKQLVTFFSQLPSQNPRRPPSRHAVEKLPFLLRYSSSLLLPLTTPFHFAFTETCSQGVAEVETDRAKFDREQIFWPKEFNWLLILRNFDYNHENCFIFYKHTITVCSSLARREN